MNKVKLSLIFIAALVFSVAIIYWQYQLHYRSNLQQLVSFNRFAQSAVNPDHVQNIIDNPVESDNTDLVRLKEELTAMANASEGIRYVYIMANGPNGIYFIVDTQPTTINGVATDPSSLAKFGEVYPFADNSIFDVIYNRKPNTISTGADKWGSFVSSAMPLYSRDRTKIIAMIGVDVDQQDWDAKIISGISLTVIFSIFFLISTIFTTLSYSKSIRKKTELLYLASILNSSSDAIISLDFNGTIRTWNIGAQKMFGYTPSDIIGKDVRMLCHKDSTWEVDNYLSQAKIGKSLFINESHQNHKDGSLLLVSVTASPIISHNNEIIGVSVINQDNTAEFKQLHELIEKNKKLEKMNQLLVGRELEMVKLKLKQRGKSES